MMKDSRDPTDVYNAILYEKTAWHCSILQAADRVEASRRAEALPLTTNGDGPAVAPPRHRERENGSSDRARY
jgi:hypothetical protein